MEEKIEIIQLEQKRRMDLSSGLTRGLHVARAIRAQQTSLSAAIHEHSRITTDEVQTLEFKMYQCVEWAFESLVLFGVQALMLLYVHHRYLQAHLTMKAKQVEGLLSKQQTLSQQLDSITKQKIELQQQYDDVKSNVNRTEAKFAHEEGEVSRLNAQLQVRVLSMLWSYGPNCQRHGCLLQDEIAKKEKLKSSISSLQRKYERERKMRQVCATLKQKCTIRTYG